MDKYFIIQYLENKYINQGYVKNGGVVADYFPREILDELLIEGIIEIQNSIIPTIVLSSEKRKEILREKVLLWKTVTS